MSITLKPGNTDKMFYYVDRLRTDQKYMLTF